MINITHFLQHNSAGAVAVAPAELMQLVEFTSCYKTVVLFKVGQEGIFNSVSEFF